MRAALPMMYNMAMAGRTKLYTCLLLAGLLYAPQSLWAQGRHAVGVTTPGTMNDVGRGNSTFRDFSYGMGSLSRSNAVSNDVLRSSVSGAGSFVIGSISSGSSMGSDVSLLTSPARSAYTNRPTGLGMPSLDFSMPRLGKSKFGNAGGITGAYVAAIANSASMPATDQPITTLVPSEPSMYKLFMERGESSFRNSEYHRAFGEFQLANDIGGNDWMSLVSMTNARFATSTFSYYSASHYARQALKSFPELPLVPLRPKMLFGDKNKFSDCMVELEDRVERFPYDADAPFLLAYFQWFEPNPIEAQKALSKALAAAIASNSPEKIEAAKMFWRGMLRTGKVSGELTPATLPPRLDVRTFVDTQPSSTSAPADDNYNPVSTSQPANMP